MLFLLGYHMTMNIKRTREPKHGRFLATIVSLLVMMVLTPPSLTQAWTSTEKSFSISILGCQDSIQPSSAISFDQYGNQYFLGNGCYGDVDPGPKQVNFRGGNAVFKLDKFGNLVWAKSIGFGEVVNLKSVAVDLDGFSYIVGYFQQSSAYNYAVDFDPGPGTKMLPNYGRYDGFVLKLNTSGEFVWANRFGGVGSDFLYSIALGATSGDLFITGSTGGIVDIDPGEGVAPIDENFGYGNSFLMKLRRDGSFEWVKTFGSLGFRGDSFTGFDGDATLSVDAQENILLTGAFMPMESSYIDFDPGIGVLRPSVAGNTGVERDIFILKLSNAGNLLWAKQLGSLGSDRGKSIASGKDGSILVTGEFAGTVDFDAGSNIVEVTAQSDQTPRRPTDGFILKLASDGSFLWVRTWGSYKDDSGVHLAVDADSNAYLVGLFNLQADLGFGSAPVLVSSNFNSDSKYSGSFVMKINPEGRFIWADAINSWDSKLSAGQVFGKVSVDAQGYPRIVGTAVGKASFRSRGGRVSISVSDYSRTFVVKIDHLGFPVIAKSESAPYLSTKKSASAKSIAMYAGLNIPKNSKLTLKLKSASSRFCRLRGASVRGVKRGPCKVVITVTPRKGRTIVKAVLLEVQ